MCMIMEQILQITRQDLSTVFSCGGFQIINLLFVAWGEEGKQATFFSLNKSTAIFLNRSEDHCSCDWDPERRLTDNHAFHSSFFCRPFCSFNFFIFLLSCKTGIIILVYRVWAYAYKLLVDPQVSSAIDMQNIIIVDLLKHLLCSVIKGTNSTFSCSMHSPVKNI